MIASSLRKRTRLPPASVPRSRRYHVDNGRDRISELTASLQSQSRWRRARIAMLRSPPRSHDATVSFRSLRADADAPLFVSEYLTCLGRHGRRLTRTKADKARVLLRFRVIRHFSSEDGQKSADNPARGFVRKKKPSPVPSAYRENRETVGIAYTPLLRSRCLSCRFSDLATGTPIA